MKDNTQKVAIITGTSSGIGADIARTLASDGYVLVITARRRDRGEALEAEIKASGSEVVFIQADLTKEEDIKYVHDFTLQKFGRIDLAVNNAGVHRMTSIIDTELEDYQAIMDTNVKAVWLGMKYQIQAMQNQGGGSIINIASNVAHNGAKNMAVYAASKHAVLGLTKAAALDHANENILINAVSPGPTRTEMFDGAVNGNQEMEDAIIDWVPLGRIGLSQDVANAVSYIASDKASFMTGHSMVIDGGTLAGFN